MTKIYSLSFFFKRSQIVGSIQIYTLGMKFINLSVSFKLATHLFNKIQNRYLKNNTIMITREMNHFMELDLILKMSKTKKSN